MQICGGGSIKFTRINGDITKTVKCPDCSKLFVHPRNLIQHRRVQHQGVRYYCQDCTHSYTRQYNLTNHRLKAHGDRSGLTNGQEQRNRVFPSMVNARVEHRPLTYQYQHSVGASVVENRPRSRKPVFVRHIVPQPRISEGQTSLGLNLNTTERSIPSATAHVVSSPMDSLTLGKTTSVNGARFDVASRWLVPNRARSSPAKKIARKSGQLPAARIRCPMCPFMAADISTIQNHAQRHGVHKHPSHYKCTLCRYSTSSGTLLAQHSVAHFNWDIFSGIDEGVQAEENRPVDGTDLNCSYCDTSLSSGSVLERHQKRHQCTDDE